MLFTQKRKCHNFWLYKSECGLVVSEKKEGIFSISESINWNYDYSHFPKQCQIEIDILSSYEEDKKKMRDAINRCISIVDGSHAFHFESMLREIKDKPSHNCGIHPVNVAQIGRSETPILYGIR